MAPLKSLMILWNGQGQVRNIPGMDVPENDAEPRLIVAGKQAENTQKVTNRN